MALPGPIVVPNSVKAKTDGLNLFSRLDSEVVKTGLCTHCGTCVGLSNRTLTMRATRRGPVPVATETGAVPAVSLGYDACPGKGLNYPDLSLSVFGKQPRNWLIGCFQNVYIGYSRIAAIRRGGASGGVITHVLVYLLEQGLVDGVVTVKQGQPEPWQAEPIIARTVDEIVACSQSVYAPVPVNTILAEIESFDGRLAYVGLPDQVASLRYLQTSGYAPANQIEYVLGPYVGMNMYFDAIKSFLRKNGVESVDEVAQLRYREGEWPGSLQIKTRSGRVLKAEKFYYNYLLPFFVTRSTLLSVDFTNELTDISVGDAWSPKYEAKREGYSVVVARSQRGQKLLETMHDQELLNLEPISLAEALSMHGHMLDFKKRGAFVRIGWRKSRGKSAPDYGYHPIHIPVSRKMIEVVVSGIFVVGGTQLARRVIEYIPIGILGPVFNALRKLWKNASKPTKRKGLSNLSFETHPTAATSRSTVEPRLRTDYSVV